MEGPVEARDICWIDRIERTATGIRVFFSEPRVVFVKGGVRSTVIEVDQNAPEREQSDKQLARVKSIEAVPGDQLRTDNNHDGCTMTVATQGTATGLSVKNWYMPPPTAGVKMEPMQTTKFIAAQQ